MKPQPPKDTKPNHETFKRSTPSGNVTSLEDRKAAQAERHWPSNLEGQAQGSAPGFTQEEEENEDVGQTRANARRPETNVEQRTARNA